MAVQGSRDYHLCMVSTQRDTDPYQMELRNSDLVDGKLSQTCFVRPTYNFSADENWIDRRIGRVKPEKLKAILFTLFTALTKDDD